MNGSERTRPVVAIDGPAGSGKSTLARRLAETLGLPFVNTGLMYRAVARRGLDLGLSPSDGEALGRVAAAMRFSLSASEPPELLVDGADPGPSAVAADVEEVVSEVAAHPAVRAALRAAQRTLGRGGAVMEGRDIGTVVFSDAEVKLFLAAPPAVRADRRARQRAGRPDAGRSVGARDAVDARTNPLEPSPDAVVLDTAALSPDEVVERALRVAAEAVPSLSASGPSHAALPKVAVVGRQNVGKSTLVNRLLGRKAAIADERPGVTRDRIEREVRWGGRSFVVVDTGGFAPRARGLEGTVAREAARAAEDADLTLLVVDAQTGLQEEDDALARRLRRASRPVLVVANKVDSERQEPAVGEFFKLGLGEPVAVSALHGRGSGDLLDRILDLIPARPQPRVEPELRFCLLGRPNVGKSSLFNRLVRQERAIVHEEAGTTRDAVDSVVRLDGRLLRFVDTAGLRRQVKTQGVEYYGLLRSLRALESAHVALLVVDAAQGLTAEDKRVAARVGEAGKGLVAALNKWDLVPSEERAGRFVRLGEELALFPGTPVLRTSALTGAGVGRVPTALVRVHEAWSRRVPTAEVNRVLEAALTATPPPRGVGRIRYGTQVSTGPPTFVLFGAAPPPASYRRYLENALRQRFDLGGVPIRLSFRAKERRRAGDRSGPVGRGGHP